MFSEKINRPVYSRMVNLLTTLCKLRCEYNRLPIETGKWHGRLCHLSDAADIGNEYHIKSCKYFKDEGSKYLTH